RRDTAAQEKGHLSLNSVTGRGQNGGSNAGKVTGMVTTTAALRERQLHVKVDERGLHGMVEDVAKEVNAALQAAGYAGIPLPAIKQDLAATLSRRTVEFDGCGLRRLCGEAVEENPWKR